MKKVQCTQASGCGMSSCPHHDEHVESEVCVPGKCSYKGLYVRCNPTGTIYKEIKDTLTGTTDE